MDDLISLADAATLIGKNLRTIQRHIKNGKLTRHQKDDKNFVSRQELESKFSAKGGNIKTTKSPETVATEQTEAATMPRQEIANGDKFRQVETQNYQKKWIEEIEKHAETREELGQWKGRAEAYQAFASRLLGPKGAPFGGNGQVPAPAVSEKKSSPAIKPVVFYIIIGLFVLLFLVLIFFVFSALNPRLF